MNMIKFDPFAPVRKGLNDDFFPRSFADLVGSDFAMNVPSVNVTKSENGFNIELATPGLNKEDFNINVEKDRLTVSSERKHEEEVNEEKYTRREFNYSSFSRSFYLPKSIDREAIEASYDNGVLKLTLPKKQEVIKEEMGRSIEIK